GLIDLQADTFSFNVNGLSGTLIIDYKRPIAGTSSYEVYCVENPDIKAEFIDLNSWKITNIDGTSYYFNRKEKTRHTFSGSGPTGLEYTELYNSAWFLTMIISPNGFDRFDFAYGPSVEWETYSSLKNANETVLSYYTGCASNNSTTVPEIPALTKYKKTQFSLTSISHNGIEILTTELNNETTNPRADHSGMRYFDKIKIRNEFTDPLLIIDFDNNHYFKRTPGQVSNTDNNSRLMLKGMDFYRESTTNDKKTYSFEYFNPNGVPSRKENSVDFWGYCNGVGAIGGSLVAYTDEFPSDLNISGIDRNSNFSQTLDGSLKSITYPTGGKTTFFYEPHKTTINPANAPQGVVGGLRIAKQETVTQDPSSSPSQVKYYYYGDIVADVNNDPSAITINFVNNTVESSGIAQQDIMFSEVKSVQPFSDNCGGNNIQQKYYQYAKNRAIQLPNNITYTHVSEIIFKGNEFLGCTVNKFYNELYNGGQGVPVRPYYNQSLLNGELNQTQVYDSMLNLVHQTLNTYETDFLGVPSGFSEYNGIYLHAKQVIPLESACNIHGANFSYYSESGSNCASYGGQFAGSAINYKVNKYSYGQFHKKLLSSSTKSYEANSYLEKTTSYTYQDPVVSHYFPIEIIGTDSKDLESKTQITYVADLINTSSIFDILLERNQISEPIEVKKYYDNNLMSTQKKSLAIFSTANQNSQRDIIRPSSIEVAKATDGLETRRIYHSYDYYGNLTEVSNPNGTRTYYIWGYNGKHLLAEIKNKPSSSIPPTIQSYIDALIIASNTENTPGEEVILRTQLDILRNFSDFNKSLVTTYTYDPGIGVTSVTDPRGYVMFYEYDQYNRLEFVRDVDNNLIGKNEYSYRVNN
ncbi:MAG: hypothetical protein JKY22_11915, partial [Flavobacteriaceae bacterium]|nr:hypothetical protein [Flavobacteriaceae bacterium]